MAILASHIGVRVIEDDTGGRPIEIVTQSVIGIIGTAPDADDTEFPLDTNVLVISDLKQAAKLGRAGTLLTQIEAIFAQSGATIVVRRIAVGADNDATVANVVGDLANKTGIYGFIDAETDVFVAPKILIAPSFTMAYSGATKNPVAVALQAMATKLSGVCVLEATNTDKVAAVAYRVLHGHDRSYIMSNSVKIYDSASTSHLQRAPVGVFAGLMVKKDKEVGVHASPSNQPILGITGVNRAIDYKLSDPDCEANYLYQNEINSIVVIGGELRILGSKLATEDTLNQFINVRRNSDLIAESVEEAMVWALSQPNNSNLPKRVLDRIDAFLLTLIAGEAILGGSAWYPNELNPIDALKLGQLSVSFDQETPAPMEDLRIYMHRNDDYYLNDRNLLAA